MTTSVTVPIVEFLSQLRGLDVRFELKDGKLGCTAPKGVLTPELTAELKARKPEIIEFLEQHQRFDVLPPITPSVREEYFAPSSGQQRLWFLGELDRNSAAYNIVGCLRFTGRLDRKALEASLREIIRRHEVLRTSIVNLDGHPKAIVRMPDWKLELRSIRHLPADARDPELQRMTAQEAAKPFDLASAPLLRATLIELGENEHATILAIHHIAADGWSLGVLGLEFAVLYDAFSKGQPSPLPELPIQYADFAQWNQDYREARLKPQQLPYWEKHLGGPLPATDLPLDRPRPATMTFNGTRSRQTLPRSVGEAVHQLSLKERVTPFIILLAAFKVLLFRYTRQPDVIIGTATAGRSRPELEKLIGFFINNLVLRTSLESDPTFRELIERVRETVLNAFAHDAVSLENLVEALHVPRDLERSPLFQVMFIYQNFPVRTFELAGLKIESVRFDSETTRFDLTIEAGDSDGELVLDWEYNTDLFDRSTMARLQNHYHRILEAVVANPEARISDVPMLEDEERREILRQGGLGQVDPYPQGTTIHDWIERESAGRGERIAARYGGESLSYGELSRRSNQLARYLLAKGAGPGELVGLCVERSVEMLVALLGILKTGAAYVPLDPEYPRERLAFMLEDSGARVVVSEAGILERLPVGKAAVVCLDRDREAIGEESGERFKSEGASAEDLAYVIYTSGSTGKPKGVEIRHRSVVNFLASMQREPGMGEGDRLVAVTTLSFDIAGLEMYLPLVSGAELVIAPRGVAGDGGALGRLLEESGATMMQATPVSWRMLLESGWQGKPGLKILCGGEALARELANRLLETEGEVWNLYGPTETTIWSTIQRVQRRPGGVPIGRPVGNTRVYVLDENRRQVPVGVVGELYIGGEGLARGYWKREELTKERFVEDPYCAGEKMYRTGDLVRWRADGSLEYEGRGDQQVKLRGHRIEMGEIETALEQMEGVRQAVVIVREDTAGDQRLTAYVAAREGVTLDTRGLRESLGAKLPDYMVPSAFMILTQFPLTPNNKVDRKALPKPEQNELVSAVFVPPRTESESRIAGIWQDLLHLERVGIHDNFFDLGAHSLLAVQLQARLQRAFGREIALVELFQRPTVEAIANFLDRQVESPALAPAMR